jgi:uncharacterized repeat protein (TIGR01451 family)
MLNTSLSASRSRYRGSRSYIGIAVFIVGAFLALPLFTGSAVSPIKLIAIDDKVSSSMPADSHRTIAVPNFNFLVPPPMAGPVTVATFASDCTTSKNVYNVQDTDLTVCATISNALPGWRVIWSNGRSVAVQTTALTAGNTTATFTLSPTSNLGDWRVIIFDALGQTVQAVTPFVVVDAANPVADLATSTNSIAANAAAGGQALFSVQVTNHGPSPATAVTLSDDVPANATFVSFDQLSGPVFTCTNPNVGDTGSTVCTITSLGNAETAVFVATYEIGAVSSGTAISNTAVHVVDTGKHHGER